MEYITVENNVITGNFCGDKIPDNAIEVNNFTGIVGEPTSFYNKNWSRKSDIELYTSGLKEIPTGYKIENNELVELSEIEKINSGLEKMPTGMKIENNELVEKTDSEKLLDKDITQNDYNNIQIKDCKANLLKTDYIIQKISEAQIENDFDLVNELKEKYCTELNNRKIWRNKINELQQAE